MPDPELIVSNDNKAKEPGKTISLAGGKGLVTSDW
jgi:hypothetical protein